MSALPALSRAYSTRANVPHPDTSTQANLRKGNWFLLKALMMNALSTGTLGGTRHANSVWTLDHSCDGTTAGSPGDAVDRLGGATFDASKWVLNTEGSAHSWAVLYNATLGIYCCLSLSATTTSGTIIFSKSAFSGGTATATPTASGMWIAGSTSGSLTTVTIWSDDVAGNINYGHYVTTDTGEFIFLASRTGQGWFSSLIGLWVSTGQQSGDTRNQFALLSVQNSGRGAGIYNLVTGPAQCSARTPNGGAVVNTGGAGNVSYAGTPYESTAGIDSITGDYLCDKIPVISLHSGSISRRGVLTDLYWVGTATVGASVPSAAAQERVVVGDMIIPFTTTPPTI